MKFSSLIADGSKLSTTWDNSNGKTVSFLQNFQHCLFCMNCYLVFHSNDDNVHKDKQNSLNILYLKSYTEKKIFQSETPSYMLIDVCQIVAWQKMGIDYRFATICIAWKQNTDDEIILLSILVN